MTRMTRMAVLAVLVLGAGVSACKKKQDSGGLPPASKWGSQTAGPGANGGAGGATGADPSNPHAGLDMGGVDDPHAGLDMSGGGGDGTDPHAGVDMSGGGGGGDMSGGMGGGNPHGGGGDMSGGRTPDPTHFLRGTLALDPKLASKLPPNAVLFLAVKRPGASGEPEGMPVMAQLIDKYDLSKPFPFDLNEGNSMMGNVPELTGDVWILAYVDSDSNATTHLTGDLLGKVKTTVPQKDLKIAIDTVLP